MAQFSFIFLEKYLKKSFVLPALPSNEKNSSNHHNSYNKSPNLACNGLLESPLNFPSTKLQLQIGIEIVCPKSLNSIYGTHSPLEVKEISRNKKKAISFWYKEQ
jgi:hypothetical protein